MASREASFYLAHGRWCPFLPALFLHREQAAARHRRHGQRKWRWSGEECDGAPGRSRASDQIGGREFRLRAGMLRHTRAGSIINLHGIMSRSVRASRSVRLESSVWVARSASQSGRLRSSWSHAGSHSPDQHHSGWPGSDRPRSGWLPYRSSPKARTRSGPGRFGLGDGRLLGAQAAVENSRCQATVKVRLDYLLTRLLSCHRPRDNP